MKKLLIGVLALVMGLSMLAVPAVVSADSGITIDGTLSAGEWDGYSWFTDNSEGPGTGYDDDPLPVFHGYLHFDENNLYLAFNVEDTTPNTNRDFLYVTIDIPEAGVFNDSIDALFWGSVPANASFFGEAYLTGNAFPWDKSQRGSTWGTDGDVITARTITDKNRYYELKIPLAAISAQIGDTIGLKIQARGGQYTSETDPQVVNYFPDMPGGITPIRADTRVEVEGNFWWVSLTVDDEGPITSNVVANPNPVAVNTAITLTATVDDSTTGGSNIASAEYSWDGGTDWYPMDAKNGAFDEVSEDVTATLPGLTAGVYNVCVRGTDTANNVGAEECILLAVYDPSAGFVTGGGWINSPAGAYTTDPDLTGKATFGFVSKYKKGASVPTGQTQFQFKVADLNFHSSSYEWLVITGGQKAMYKGTGTINGAVNCGFMLSATDADIDTFRIKIWDKDTGTTIYDNKTGIPDETELGGGKIVVHKK